MSILAPASYSSCLARPWYIRSRASRWLRGHLPSPASKGPGVESARRTHGAAANGQAKGLFDRNMH
jgi:hypothetical protein